MEKFANNLSFLIVLGFTVALTALGLLLVIGVLTRKITAGEAAVAIGVSILLAAAVIWSAWDFTHDKIMVDILGVWIKQILTASIGG